MDITKLCACVILMVAVASTKDTTVGVGQSFFLPKEDILSPLYGGRHIFKQLDSNCYRWDKLRTDIDDRTSYENSKQFYKKVSSDSSLSVDLTGAYTMGTTIGVKTSSMTNGSTDIRGTSLNIRKYVNVTYLDQDCFKSSKSQLIDDLVNALDQLPQHISNPWLPDSWNHYETFLKTFGTHMVVKTYLGAAVRQWTFSKSTSGYSDHQLKVKACVDLAGLTQIGKLGVNPCVGVTKEDAQSVSSLDTSSFLNIRGGSAKAQEKFRIERTNEALSALLLEAKEMQFPADYKYEAIWDILMMKFNNDKVRYAKAINLMHYYHGYKDFGCSFQHGESHDVKLRAFTYSQATTSDAPKFECVLINRGCHADSDCWIGKMGVTTYCHGPTCYEYDDPPTGFRAKSVSVRRERHGHHDDGINQSCHYKHPFRAYCIENYFHSAPIWDGEPLTRSAMYDAISFQQMAVKMDAPADDVSREFERFEL